MCHREKRFGENHVEIKTTPLEKRGASWGQDIASLEDTRCAGHTWCLVLRSRQPRVYAKSDDTNLRLARKRTRAVTFRLDPTVVLLGGLVVWVYYDE